MIDTHAHLDFSEFDVDRQAVIQRFLASGGKWLVNIGVDTERNKKALALADEYSEIYCSLGYHPEELAEKSLAEILPEAEKFLREKGKEKKVVAIGEIGLDYFHNSRNKEDQKKLFIAQLEIATEFGLPVILHCRDAYEDVFDIISKLKSQSLKLNSKSKTFREKESPVFVLHCYGGNLEQTERFLALPNVYFSFTGNITFPKSRKTPSIPLSKGGGQNPLTPSASLQKEGRQNFPAPLTFLQKGGGQNSNSPVFPLILKGEEKMVEPEIFQVIKRIPLNRIMAETDCPYLAPSPHRGKRNEPSYVKMVIIRLAEIRKTSFEEMEKITDQNAEEFFGKK